MISGGRLHHAVSVALVAAAFVAVARSAAAHEPIFGIGPRVIWKDGLGLQVTLDRERQRETTRARHGEQNEEVCAIDYEFLYGLTANQAITVEVPHILQSTSPRGSNAGIGDILLRYKGRFYRRDVLGGVYQASVLAGVELPTGEHGVSLATGSGTYDLLAGVAADYEGRRWLIFGAGRYKHNGTTAENVDVGDALIVDAAVGFRPVRTPYLAPDTVVMVELNYHSRGRGRRRGALMPDTGREVLFLSAGVWLTYRNHAFKPGIQVPIFSDVNGNQPRPAWRAVFSYEVHTGGLFGR